MRLEDAPPPGWYPDPERGDRLRWWAGDDWTDARRAPPTTKEMHEAVQAVARAAATAARAGQGAAGQARPVDTDRVISQVRDATREELTRAGDMLSARARSVLDEGRSVVDQYSDRFFRWLRIALVLAAVLVIAWFVFEFVAQATFFDWLGDRIDNLTDE